MDHGNTQPNYLPLTGVLIVGPTVSTPDPINSAGRAQAK